MRRPCIPVAALLALCAVGSIWADTLLPADFVLIGRAVSESKWSLGVHATSGNVAAEMKAYDAVLQRVQLSYLGTGDLRFGNAPVSGEHAFVLRVPRRKVELALRPTFGVDVHRGHDRMVKYHCLPRYKGSCERVYYKSNEELINHSAFRYGGTLNFALRGANSMREILFGGYMQQDRGYELTNWDIGASEEIEVRDYNPQDLSYRLVGGMVSSYLWRFAKRRVRILWGALGSREDLQQRVKAQSARLPDRSSYYADDVEVTYVGRRLQSTRGTVWAGLQPAYPFEAKKVDLLYRGRFVHGATITSAGATIELERTSKVLYSFVAASTNDTLGVTSDSSDGESTHARLYVVPAFLPHRQFSLHMPLALEQLRSDGKNNGFSQLEGHVSLEIRFWFPVAGRFRVEVAANSGRFARDFAETGRYPYEEQWLYRAYSAWGSLSIAGMW